MPQRKVDVVEMIERFVNKNAPDARAATFTEVSRQLRSGNRSIEELCAHIAQEAMHNRCTPAQVLYLGLIYGCTIGILAEQERIRIQ